MTYLKLSVMINGTSTGGVSVKEERGKTNVAVLVVGIQVAIAY